MNNETEVVRDIRAFSRFYTDIIGLLDQHLLDSSYSLAEVRILYELYNGGDMQASNLMELMRIDKSYLSRVLKKLERDGLIGRLRSVKDGRAVVLSLTVKGKAEFEVLNEASDNQIARLLAPLADSQKQAMAAEMRSVMQALKPSRLTLNDISIRNELRPGDLGYVAYLHGELYTHECGYGLNFEGYVLESMGEFAHQYNPVKDRIWVCGHNHKIIGFLAAVNRGDQAQLRYFIFQPEYRGIGLGKKLMGEFMAYLKEQGFNRAYLWTTNEQHTATALYKKYGFRLAEEKMTRSFDKELVEQRYVMEK